jgi:hypothetical protein
MKRLCAVAGLVAIAGLAMAAPPSGVMNYQGRLTDGGGNASGSYNLVFRFYSSSIGGVEICNTSKPGTTVSGGVFTTSLGATVTDGPGVGVYTDLADVFIAFPTLYIQTEVNGTPISPRTRIDAAPHAINADRANSLADTTIVSGSVLTVAGISTSLTIAGDSLDLQLGDTNSDVTKLQGTLQMTPNSFAEIDQRINFYNGGSATGESILWDDSDDRFEFSDSVAMSGPLMVGTTTVATEVFSRFGTAASTSGAMNNIADVFIGADLEVASNLISQGDIRLRSGLAEGDGVIYFREDANDVGESFRWDDSVDRFVVTDGFHIQGNLTLEDPDGFSDIQSSGGITIRIDTDNNESGPNAGVFALVAHAAEVLGTPLMRMQSTDEANLELDSGVTTNAFDFAEAFRPVADQMDMEPGDVVALAVGGANKEHVELSTQPGQAMLLGVVSTKPAFTCGMGISAVQESDPVLASLQKEFFEADDQWGVNAIGDMLSERVKQEWRPIAMLGRVPCKVDTTYGTIRAGDRLTSSPTAGHAMKQIGPGMSLGIAMEDASQPGKILILVRPMWYGGSAGEFGDALANASPRANVINASHTPALGGSDSPRVAELEAETRDLKARLADLERLVTSQMQGNKSLSAR